MHELSLAESLVDLVEERLASDLAGRSVVAAHLRVGRDSGVMAEAMVFCWQAVTTGTALDGSVLEIEEVPGEELALARLELRKLDVGKEEPCAPPVAVVTSRIAP